MRHARKSRSQRIDGYKRHVLPNLDTRLVRAVGVTPANAPEASVTDSFPVPLESQGPQWVELHSDQGYLHSRLVRERPPELAVYCKAWSVRHGASFPKTAFTLDWEAGIIRGPNAVTISFKVGSVVYFPAAVCAACPFRGQYTSSAQGRSVSIHPDEPLLQEVWQR